MARKGMFPTPTTQDAANNAGESQTRRNTPPLNVVALETVDPSWPTAVTTDAASSARHTTTTGIMNSGTTLTDAMREHVKAMSASRPSRQDDSMSGDGPDYSLNTPTSPQQSPEIDRDNKGRAKMVLNVLFVEHLMGFPIGWTGLEPVATASYQSWLATHSSILAAVRGSGELVAANNFVKCTKCGRIVKGKPTNEGMCPSRHKDPAGKKWCVGSSTVGEYVDWEKMRA